MRGEVILRLMFRALQILTNGIEFLERTIDRAVLPAGQEQSTLAVLKILLNCGPTGSANSLSSSGDVCGDFVVLKRVKVLEFLETKSEYIVIEGLRRTTEQAVEGGIVICRVARV